MFVTKQNLNKYRTSQYGETAWKLHFTQNISQFPYLIFVNMARQLSESKSKQTMLYLLHCLHRSIDCNSVNIRKPTSTVTIVQFYISTIVFPASVSINFQYASMLHLKCAGHVLFKANVCPKAGFWEVCSYIIHRTSLDPETMIKLTKYTKIMK